MHALETGDEYVRELKAVLPIVLAIFQYVAVHQQQQTHSAMNPSWVNINSGSERLNTEDRGSLSRTARQSL